ncbi:MAG TPA: pitrilysin family protein [Thermodesulfobacteriota bacterium]|nr:pitrilysin family protein [Thermodesulfobacteriota bacterium]
MYRKTVLDNGIKIITEKLPYFQSITFGIWVMTGSRHENKEENGISHFIEHMLFKGTEKRGASDIAREIDSVGGILNAFTSKEYTCLYVKVLDRHLDLAIDLLLDIFLNSNFKPEEAERERGVILQEIRMVEDTPDENIQDMFSQSFFKDHPLSYPILGSLHSVRRISRKKLLSCFTGSYHQPSHIIVSAAGKIEHEKLVDKVASVLASFPHEELTPPENSFHPSAVFFIRPKKLEQVQICLGTKGLSQVHPSRFTSYLLNTILGGGMSSRLFQEIREKRGLAYTVYSYQSSYRDTGLFTIYMGVGEDTAEQAISLVIQELKRLKEEPVTDAELLAAKEQLKGNLLLASENTDNRMTRLAKSEIYFNKFVTIEDVLKNIDKTTSEAVGNLAREIFNSEYLSLAVLGPVNKKKFSPEILTV